MLKLYYADTSMVSKQDVFERYMKQMNEQRRQKVLRCKNEEDKLCSLLAGVLLRYGLEELGLDYDTLVFAVTPEKKPVLQSHPQIHFSLSHSGNRAVCLLSDGVAGVDVEYRHRRLIEDNATGKRHAVARKCFTEQEYCEYIQAEELEQRELFLKYWTRKEAVSKAVGKGLGMDFSKIHKPEEHFLSKWMDEEYYLSIYVEGDSKRKELEICMMN